MAHKEKNKPKFEDKEGNMKVQMWINKNKDNKKYAIFKIWRYRFPFKYNASIDLYTSEIHKLRDLLKRLPEIEIKQLKSTKKDGNKHKDK